MKSEIGDVAAGVKHLTVSGKPKRKFTALSKAETEHLNRQDIEELNVNREYILRNQPWFSDELPRGYLPDPATKWYPPIFCLGMALSQQETAKFAEYLGLPLDERAMYRYGVSRHLNEICGGKPRIMVERCDVGGSPDDDRTWLFSLVTNYDIYRGVNVDEPLRKYREIVKKVFGPSSRKVLWWLEYTVNRTPGHWRWDSHRPEWIDEWDPECTYRFEDEQ